MGRITKFGFDKIKGGGGSRELTESENRIIERRLRYLGEEMCNHARTVTPNHDSGGYNDHTRNLRGSIGYSIYHNGKFVADGGYDGNNSKDGIENAKKALERFGTDSKIPLVGWALILVAGMSYATYVEAKGYNVLSLTEVELNKEIEALKSELGL